MTAWTLLDTTPIPGKGGELRLYRRREEFSIMIVGGGELMNSRTHGSEDALAQLACSRLEGRAAPRVLIGGLGMGFTLAAALEHLPTAAEVVVAELIPAVVEWNRGPLGECARHPLRDTRTEIRIGDVAKVLRKERGGFDAVLLDVDNGPEGLTRKDNDWLYSPQGLNCAFDALRADGVLAVWSAGPDSGFFERLRQTGFDVEEVRVRSHPSQKRAHHRIWLAGRGQGR